VRFWEFYRIAVKRRWMILGMVLITVVAICLATANEEPFYQARVQLMPSAAALYKPVLQHPTVGVAGPPKELGDSQLPNLMSLLASNQVAERAIRMAGITDTPEGLRYRMVVSTATNPGARSRDDSGTDMIVVTVKDSDPQRAVKTVNAIAHVFSNYYQEISHQEAVDSRKFLEQQLEAARNNLEAASNDLRSFKLAHNITSLPEMTSTAMASLRQSISDRDAARSALAEANAKLADVNRQLRSMGPTRRVTEGTTDSPMLHAIEGELAQATQALNDARSKYMEEHPRVLALKAQVEEINDRLEQERTKMKMTVSQVRNPVYEQLLQQKATLQAERDGLAAKVAQLSTSVGSAVGSITPGLDVELLRLENEFQTAQNAYNNLETQLHQAKINERETSSTGAIRIVDTAERAEGPIGSNRLAYIGMGIILSLVVGLGLAITMDALDNRIKSKTDLEHLLALPVTALIPRYLEGPTSDLARLSHTDPLSPIAEAYRFLRTDLLLTTEQTDAKSIMVATAKPGQGGTTTAANLAISLAMDGKRVILVDADMRRPSLHRIFKAANEYGLSSILCNEKDFQDVVVSTEIDNLLLLPAGPAPSNPAELLGSARMRMLVDTLSEYADYVLFDTPSAIAFTDSVVLSQLLDGVMLVVRAQQVPRGVELQVRNLLNKANANILGVVLNDVQPEMVDSYYYHSHYYPNLKRRKPGALPGSVSERSLPPTGE